MNILFKIFVLFVCVCGFESRQRLSDPKNSLELGDNFEVKTSGRPVPLPQIYKPSSTQYSLSPKQFEFEYAQGSYVCEVVTLAFNRYHKIIFRPTAYEINENQRGSVRKLKLNKPINNKRYHQADSIQKVLVNVRNPCEDYPSLESDESCKLNCIHFINLF